MLKSSLLVSISALTLRSTKALWAMTIVCAVAIAAVIHLLTHDDIAVTKALRDLAALDALGSAVYIVGVAIFG